MVRAAYDFNKNFGRADNPQLERASFDLLFRFTGLKGDLGAQLIGQDISNLPNNYKLTIEGEQKWFGQLKQSNCLPIIFKLG